MSDASQPIGLHVHLVGSGPTLRFALWFEAAAGPTAHGVRKYLKRELPVDHPFALPSRSHKLPPWLTAEFKPTPLLVKLPRLEGYCPISLPGLAAEWDLSSIRSPGRAAEIAWYRVPAWVVPARLSLEPLRALLSSWTERVGPGFVSPHAPAVMALLSSLHARLCEGPLLPTLGLEPARWHLASDSFLPPKHEALTLAWAPPVRLSELNALRAPLLAQPFLAAVADDPLRYFGGHEAPRTWAQDPLPQRLAVFLRELFDGAARASGSVPGDLREKELTSALRAGALRDLHAAHGDCLDPHHALHQQSGPPKTHLHARMHLAEDNAWDMELGLLATADAFLPVRELLAQGATRDPAVDFDEATWTIPASVIERDWRQAAHLLPDLCAPELLTGRARLSAAAGSRVLGASPLRGESSEYRTWLDSIGAPGNARAHTCLTAAAATSGDARVRVTWELDPTRGETLHGARFTPSLDLAVGDVAMDPGEVEAALGATQEAFVRLYGKVLGRAGLEAALALLRAREKVLTKLDAKKGLSLSRVVDLDDLWAAERAAALTESLFSERWRHFLAQLRDGAGVALLDAPADFQGTLRPYQRRGLSWMHFLVSRGFGGCLADDMGLGKTVQVLALLAARRVESPDAPPDLVVCPTAVVLNWAREAKRFTPKLRVSVHQGPERSADAAAMEAARARSDLVVTSYALLRRDSALFEASQWSLVVVDEAQNLKNPEAQQTRAAKSLQAQAKLCLTGTPVENQLRDLWSVFDLAIPGLLGGQTRFARSFVAPMRSEPSRATQRLSARVGPFLLRRTKKDPAIAGDLPPKQEQEAWCDLTKEQVTLYQAMTEATLEGIVGKDGVARRAHILAALTRFKQICNHPENFHTEHPDRLLGRSGKLDRALELIEELVAEEQRVLVFTQFTEMGEILRRALAASLDIEADFYHGGLTPKAREEIVTAFNGPEGPPVLIVSLRAGGSGLNLTAASAVIHYDRWWNPAVEDQATDRAHRIGQTRMVSVFKLATRGTLEERVVDIIESKRALATQVLGGADASFITEMSDRELRAFLSLGAVSEES